MFKLLSMSAVAVAMALPAFAVDGVTLINESTVAGAGGFPYKITQPGSYRLSGDLAAAKTTAIDITASNVTLDFDGFSISCTACNGVSGIVSSGAGTIIKNGTVTGFSATGTKTASGLVFNGPGGKVDHMRVTDNYTGVSGAAGVDLTVTGSNVSSNASVGISGPYSVLTVLNSVISENRQDGIDAGTGLISGNTINSNGYGGSFLRGGIIVFNSANSTLSVTNNVIANNVVFGIASSDANAKGMIGIGSNTFGGSQVDLGGGAVVAPYFSMKNNVNASGAF